MREILFRGKRVDNGEWVYGGYHKHIARQICPIGDKLEECDIIHLMIHGGFADWNMSRPLQATEVIPKTVGQFTGLTDKNSTKIFEGDIVIDTSYDFSEFTGVVVYDVDEGKFKLENWEKNYGITFQYFDSSNRLEVIGNIHEKENYENK